MSEIIPMYVLPSIQNLYVDPNVNLHLFIPYISGSHILMHIRRHIAEEIVTICCLTFSDQFHQLSNQMYRTSDQIKLQYMAFVRSFLLSL